VLGGRLDEVVLGQNFGIKLLVFTEIFALEALAVHLVDFVEL
jgi:hypothetical protein